LSDETAAGVKTVSDHTMGGHPSEMKKKTFFMAWLYSGQILRNLKVYCHIS
jgi:hypothetical protein